MLISTCQKWHYNLVGTPFIVHTNHHTLEHFLTQHDLSCCQLHWQKLLFQYNFTILYVPGTENTVANALSRLPPDSSLISPPASMHYASLLDSCTTLPAFPIVFPVIAPIMSIVTDPCFLNAICKEYMTDAFASKLVCNIASTPRASLNNGLLYLSSWLVLPNVPVLRE